MKGVLTFHEPLAPHTSWHIGGVADKYYHPFDLEDLSSFLSTIPAEEPITWLGLGSNVLIADEGIRGTVIHMLWQGAKNKTQETRNEESLGFVKDNHAKKEKKTIRAEAGVTCAKLAKFCAKEGLIGAEFFAGIPGTIGGALAMNAGAWGGETWDQVCAVEVMNRRGERVFHLPSEYQIGYRLVQGPKEEWFVAGHFQFAEGDPEIATLRIKELLRQRNASQPTGVFSCGSVFKNPKGHYAGQLIEAAQLKGFRIGGAEVSPKHANFILNHGNATANDVLQLITHIKKTVFTTQGICLETEVRLLGF